MRRRDYVILSAGLNRDNVRVEPQLGRRTATIGWPGAGAPRAAAFSAGTPGFSASGGRRRPAFRWRLCADLPLFDGKPPQLLGRLAARRGAKKAPCGPLSPPNPLIEFGSGTWT